MHAPGVPTPQPSPGGRALRVACCESFLRNRSLRNTVPVPGAKPNVRFALARTPVFCKGAAPAVPELLRVVSSPTAQSLE